VPQVLLDQLKPGGRIVMPLGDPGSIQRLIKVTKHEDRTLEQANLGAVRFVPLVGAHGFTEA
jgi:protein-L-isoaspartate O-methyltransferase